MRLLKTLLVVVLSVFPAVFHYRVTSALLWNHGSSAALELCIAMWVIAAGIFGYACMIAYIDLAPEVRRWRRVQ